MGAFPARFAVGADGGAPPTRPRQGRGVVRPLLVVVAGGEAETHRGSARRGAAGAPRSEGRVERQQYATFVGKEQKLE